MSKTDEKRLEHLLGKGWKAYTTDAGKLMAKKTKAGKDIHVEDGPEVAKDAARALELA